MWDVNSTDSDPELFATTTRDDLKLDERFAMEISFAVREQVMVNPSLMPKRIVKASSVKYISKTTLSSTVRRYMKYGCIKHILCHTLLAIPSDPY